MRSHQMSSITQLLDFMNIEIGFFTENTVSSIEKTK